MKQTDRNKNEYLKSITQTELKLIKDRFEKARFSSTKLKGRTGLTSFSPASLPLIRLTEYSKYKCMKNEN